MMVNLASVDEEIDNETIMEKPTECVDENEREDKVRVDRRKLEQMLQVNGVEDGLSAEQFFTKVMVETCTRISWPSKLKIGAKSKKDPHIKIAGVPENITRARDMVVAVLESKANRVTLKMDVSHTDHSHIIGRRGQSIKKVMEETGCHIHFPDSNRGSTTTEKSNQVSIAGQPEGVEKARTRIRELLPLVLMFEVPFNNGYLPFEPNSPSVQSIAQAYDVTFMPKGRSPMGSLIIVLRGSPNNMPNIQQAIGCLYKHLTGRYQIPNIVSLQFDIAPQHHVFVLGRSGCNIKHIIETTGAKIDFPDPSSMSRKGTVVMSGSINAVVQARAMLLKSLPMLLMFDLKEGDASFLEKEPDKLKKLMDKFCVTIMVKPKPKQTSKSVVIKSMESNAQNMYLTRLEIFGSPMDPYTTQHPTFTTLPRETQEPNLIFPPTTTIPWYPVVTQPHYQSPIHSPTVPMRTTPSPPRLPPPGFGHRKSGSFNNGDFSVYSGDTSTTRSHGASSEGNSPKHSIDYKYLRRNSEPTPLNECWPQRQTMLDMSAGSNSISLTSSGSNQKFLFNQTCDTSPKESNLIESRGSDSISSLNTSASLSYNFDRFLNLQPQSKFIDYEKQTDKAHELLMKDKVVQHQIRTPTDQWSGLLLSKSSPAHALKNPIRQDPLLGIPSPSELSKGDKSAIRQDFSASVKYPLSYTKRQSATAFSEHQNGSLLKSFSPKDATLYEILKLYDVESYAQKLEELEIDFATFITLTKDDLIEAGVEPLGARKKMEHAIKDMKDLQERAIENDIKKRAFDFRVTNPLEFNCRSGRW